LLPLKSVINCQSNQVVADANEERPGRLVVDRQQPTLVATAADMGAVGGRCEHGPLP